MTQDPIEFVSKLVPELFNAAMADLKALADQGDADAKQRHGDLLKHQGALRIVLEGDDGADLYLVVKDGSMQVSEKTPATEIMMALAAPFEALELGLEELADDIKAALPKLRKRLTRLRPAEAMALFQRVKAEPLHFHQVLKDTPDFDEVRIKIAVGSGTPPQKPTFTITVDYDTFEELRAGKVKPQAMMSKLQMSGDFSRAMQLGMELMQQRR